MNFLTHARSSVKKLLGRHSKTLFIHIGTHKTGTTSIQNFLRENVSELKSSGIYVPRSCTTHDYSGHHGLAWAMRGDSRYSPRFGGMDEMISELCGVEEERAVISSEDFEYLSQYPAKLAEMDKAFRKIGFEPMYIVYFRETESHIKSLHAELLKHGLISDFESFRREALTNKFVVTHGDWYCEMNPKRFLQQWRAIIGYRILHFNYNKQGANDGLLPHFLSQIGAPANLILKGKSSMRMNVSA